MVADLYFIAEMSNLRQESSHRHWRIYICKLLTGRGTIHEGNEGTNGRRPLPRGCAVTYSTARLYQRIGKVGRSRIVRQKGKKAKPSARMVSYMDSCAYLLRLDCFIVAAATFWGIFAIYASWKLVGHHRKVTLPISWL